VVCSTGGGAVGAGTGAVAAPVSAGVSGRAGAGSRSTRAGGGGDDDGMGSGAGRETSSTVGGSAATIGWLAMGTTRAGGGGMSSGGPSERERACRTAHPLIPAASIVHAAAEASVFTTFFTPLIMTPR
jgi:hypothetical protein